MAHSISWKTTTFESSPIATDKIGQAYAEIQKTRKAVGERIASEHSMDDAEDLSGNQGRHNVGAARLFYYDDIANLPAVPSTAKAFDSDDGYAKGRAALVRYSDPDDVGVYYYKLFVYKVDTVSSAWVEPSYVHSGDVAESIQGLKTFDKWPLVDEAKASNKYDTIATDYPYGNPASPDTALVPVKSVKQALADYLAVVRNDVVPIGFIYTQYPAQPAPSSIWSWATWTNVSDAFAGYFFRAEGGGAAAFGAAQAQQMPEHDHSIPWNGANPTTVGNQSDAGVIDYDDWGADDFTRDAVPTVTGKAGAGTELRPANFAIRIWKRTA